MAASSTSQRGTGVGPQAGVVRAGGAGARQGGMFSALRFRNYRLFWIGQVVSVTGTFMQGTAQQWLVLQLTRGDPLALGVVGALQFGPSMVPIGAAVADRFPRRGVLVATQSLSAILAFILFLLTITGVVQMWQVYTLALLLGLVNAVDMPTRQAFVSEMVPADHLLNAISLNSAQFNVARIAGPGVAGALIWRFGVPTAFLLNALSFVAVIGGLLMMRPGELVPVPHANASHGIGGRLRDIGEGFRFIFTSRGLLITFLVVTVVGTMGFNFNVLLPLEATSILHAGPAVFGLLTSSLGVGALAGALTLARRGGKPTNTLLAVSAGVFGVLLAAVALPRTVPLVMAVIVVAGFFMSMFGASANTRMQLSSPPELRGRVMAVYSMVFIGTTPIGNLIVSGVAASAGVPWSFAVSGIPCALAALLAAYLWRRQSARAAVAAPAAAPAPVPPEDAPAKGDTPPLALPTVPEQAYESGADGSRVSGAPRPWQGMPGRPAPSLRAAEPD